MGNFNRDNKSGFRRGGGFNSNRDRGFGGGGFGDRSERPTMHKAICDNCGKECEVPFRPTSGKPIFCSSCFESKRGSDSRSSDSRGSAQSQPQNNQQLEALNSKLDRILQILEPIVSTEEVTKPAKKRPPKKAPVTADQT